MTESGRKERHAPTDEDRMIAAYLLTEERKDQKQIASHLGLSQATVSRLLAKAAEKGEGRLIDVEPRFVGSDADRERCRRLWSARSDFGDLKDRIERMLPEGSRGILRNVQVHPIASSDVLDVDPWDMAAIRIGRAAAPRVLDLLRRSERCGVGWGRSVCATCRGIAELKPERGDGDPIVFFPVWGEVFGASKETPSAVFAESEISATASALKLAEMLNGSTAEVPSLLASPGIVPLKYNGRELAVIKKFIHDNESYTTIFGDHAADVARPPNGRRPDGALIGRMDTLLGAVGSPKQPGRFYSDRFIREAAINFDQLKELVIGDFAGVLIPRDGLGASERETLRRINDHWMGIEEADIVACARRAVGSPFAGVVVVTLGPVRAEIVTACLERGMINELILDDQLARKLGEIADAKAERPSAPAHAGRAGRRSSRG